MAPTPAELVELVMRQASDTSIPKGEKEEAIKAALRNIQAFRSDLDRSQALIVQVAEYYGLRQPARAPDAALVREPPRRTMSTDERRERTLELAHEAVERGDYQVTTEDIAEVLRGEGDPTGPKLTTAVGNILTNAGWRRVKSGVYEGPIPQKREAEELSIDA